MADPIFVYVDVDDTLVRKVRGKEVAIPAVVRHIKRLHREGAVLHCWSDGGADYARQTAQRLGIDGCFSFFLRKPHVLIDDERSEEWPCFVHVFPTKLGTLNKYRILIQKKKEASPG
jgi:phosphoglycolate phosphatase-like HAD superfamily hydrolase